MVASKNWKEWTHDELAAWRQDTACLSCKSPATYSRSKRGKLQINCSCCGPQMFQTREGQKLIEARLASGDTLDIVQLAAGEVPEPEEQLKPEPVPEPVPEKTGKKGRFIVLGLVAIVGGMGWLTKLMIAKRPSMQSGQQ